MRLIEWLRSARASWSFEPSRYWEDRYASGGTSGAGSQGRLAAFKAATINRLLEEHQVESVADFGCGDGRQLELLEIPEYLGLDVSRTAVATCRRRFMNDPTKRFEVVRDPAKWPIFDVDAALSLDVIYHLTDEAQFVSYMSSLFGSARKLVVVYSTDYEEKQTTAMHIRRRRFTTWVDNHVADDWRLMRTISPPWPYDPADEDNTSDAAFFIYECQETGGRID